MFENGALTVDFLKSKLAGDEGRGVASHGRSAAELLADPRQYLRDC